MREDPFAQCDFNLDGKCDQVDANIIQQALGSCVGDSRYFLPADSNFDRCVTRADFRALFPIEGAMCDIDGDNSVDKNDIALVLKRRNQSATSNDPADSDRDGKITATDARLCVAKCDRAQCAAPSKIKL